MRCTFIQSTAVALIAAFAVEAVAQEQGERRRRAPREYSGTIQLHSVAPVAPPPTNSAVPSAALSVRPTAPGRSVAPEPREEFAPAGPLLPTAPRKPDTEEESNSLFELPSTAEMLGVAPVKKESGWGWLADAVNEKQEQKQQQRAGPDRPRDDMEDREEYREDTAPTNRSEAASEEREMDTRVRPIEAIAFQPTDAALQGSTTNQDAGVRSGSTAEDLLEERWGRAAGEESRATLAMADEAGGAAGSRSIGQQEAERADPLSSLPRIDDIAERTAALLGRVDESKAAPAGAETARRPLLESVASASPFTPTISGATAIERDSASWRVGSPSPTDSGLSFGTASPSLTRDGGISAFATPSPAASAGSSVGGWSIRDRDTGSGVGIAPRPTLESSLDRPAVGGNTQPSALPW